MLKTVYLPPMNYDLSRVIAVAMSCAGIEAVALPSSDSETRSLAQNCGNGEECTPFRFIAGDVMKLLKSGGGGTVFLPGVSASTCNMNTFTLNLRHILDKEGFGSFGIFSPDLSDSGALINTFGETALRVAWRGIIAFDLLNSMLLQTRPFEKENGRADAIYREGLDAVIAAMRLQTLDALIDAILRAKERFDNILRQDKELIPVGLFGEMFMRWNTPMNVDSVRNVEYCGGCMYVPPFLDDVRFIFSGMGNFYELLCYDEVMLKNAVTGEFTDDWRAILALGAKYVPSALELPRLTMTLGRIVYMAERFNLKALFGFRCHPMCMVSAAEELLIERIKKDLGNIPVTAAYFHTLEFDRTGHIKWILERARSFSQGPAKNEVSAG